MQTYDLSKPRSSPGWACLCQIRKNSAPRLTPDGWLDLSLRIIQKGVDRWKKIRPRMASSVSLKVSWGLR